MFKVLYVSNCPTDSGSGVFWLSIILEVDVLVLLTYSANTNLDPNIPYAVSFSLMNTILV